MTSPSGKSSPGGSAKGLLIAVAINVVLVYVFWPAAKPSQADVPQEVRTSASPESLETMAFVINASGNLCAKVVRMARQVKDTYDVVCTEYRAGATSTATYQVDLTTGRVAVR